jgi:hypothetical protein
MVEELDLDLVLACQGNRSAVEAESIDLRRADQGAYSWVYLLEAVLEEPTGEDAVVQEVLLVA